MSDTVNSLEGEARFEHVPQPERGSADEAPTREEITHNAGDLHLAPFAQAVDNVLHTPLAGGFRTASIDRNTTETKIKLTLNLDGQGTYNVRTGIRFFDHMLELFTRHGGFDLDLHCDGDLDVDQHHTVEDVGIALGEGFDKALGDKKGILRAGYFVMAMDETLAVAAIDLSGRTGYVVDDQVNVPLVGDLQTELVTDFFDGFARGGRCNVHVKTMYGRSNHHKIEAIFKAFARALRGAVSRDERMKDLLPSTKGLL